MYFELDNDRGHNIINFPRFEEKLENHVKYLGHTEINTQYGKLIEKSIGNRTYIIHEHRSKSSEKMGLLIFYHGSREIGWMAALEYTRWIEHAEKNKLIVVFGQAQGEQVYPHKHDFYDQISHGELYFEIRDSTAGFQEDIRYTQDIINNIKQNYNVNDERIYFVGHSNGGVFGCLLPVHLPNTFRGIVSHMGGIGHDPHFYLDFSKLCETDNRTPILFYTGEYDVHKHPCQAAYEIYKSENFPIVDIFIEPNLDHTYSYSCEQPAIIEAVRNTIDPYDAQRHADIVRHQLTKMGYAETQIGPWMDAILDL